MPHCQKEFSKPPVSSKQKKEQQKAKKEQDAAKKAKKAKADEEEEKARKAEEEEQEQDPALQEAERARALEAEKKEADAQKVKDAKAKGGEAFKVCDWAEALECYSQCIELEPEEHIHWSNRAAVHMQLANFEEALADATKCTELDPEFAKGWARVGGANVSLERFDAADKAFREGLILEPENAACWAGLKNIEKAKEKLEKAKEKPQEHEFDVLLKQLQGLELKQLQTRALEEGLEKDKVDEAEGSADPKAALISLITAHKYLVDLITEELQGLELAELQDRALQEGMEEDKVKEAADHDDPLGALTSLIVKYLSNELVDAATELQEEAAEDYEDSSDEEDNNIDVEVVMDESDLQLAEGDVFLAGAYIDTKYGELVLPNGTRLGNRSLNKFYKQRARPNDRQLHIRDHHSDLARLVGKIKRQEDRMKLAKSTQMSSGASKAMSTQLARSVYKRKEADNAANRAIVHHWGAGGGGSHYHLCGGKQYNKGNKVKGVVLRHSAQGAKLQAARNKQNRGNKSVACLQ